MKTSSPFSLVRTYLRYAGRIGWYDGRRGYPGEDEYQEHVLHGTIPEQSVSPEPPTQDAAAAEAAVVRALSPIR